MKLTFVQEKILDTLKKTDLASKFYWTGGTLLAHFYLHHRQSFDLDFFTEIPFKYEELIPFLEALKRVLGVDHLEETRVYDRWDFVIPGVPTGGRFEFVYYNHIKKRLAPSGRFTSSRSDSTRETFGDSCVANETELEVGRATCRKLDNCEIVTVYVVPG